jgi:hypothetical protein
MTTRDVTESEPSPSESLAVTSIRAVRVGHGANCSSIGSVIDTLFVTALVGGAIFTAIVAALGEERVHVVNAPREGDDDEGATAGGAEPKP